MKRTARKTKLLFRYIQPHINGWADLWDPDNSYESSFIEFETLLPLSPSFIILQHTNTTIFSIEYNFPTLFFLIPFNFQRNRNFLSNSNFNDSFSKLSFLRLNIIFNPRLYPSLLCPLLLTGSDFFLKKKNFSTSQLNPNSNTLSEKGKRKKNKTSLDGNISPSFLTNSRSSRTNL